MASTYTGKVFRFSLKDIMLSEISQSRRDCMIPLTGSISSNSSEQEVERGLPKGLGRGKSGGEVVLNGDSHFTFTR